MIKTEKDAENKLIVGTVHVKAPTFDGSSHWATYLCQYEPAACANNWTEKGLSLIHIFTVPLNGVYSSTVS